MTAMKLEIAECKNCGHEIIRSELSPWIHTRALFLNRGCRSASYSEATGWDDSLERKWYASPKRGTVHEMIG